MLRCQAILDGDNGLSCVVGDPLQHRILQVRAAKYPTATMEMQIYPARLRRCDYAQGDLVAVLAGDGHGSRPFREHGGGERTVAPPTRVWRAANAIGKRGGCSASDVAIRKTCAGAGTSSSMPGT